jgi:hypothetical protein
LGGSAKKLTLAAGFVIIQWISTVLLGLEISCHGSTEALKVVATERIFALAVATLQGDSGIVI